MTIDKSNLNGFLPSDFRSTDLISSYNYCINKDPHWDYIMDNYYHAEVTFRHILLTAKCYVLLGRYHARIHVWRITLFQNVHPISGIKFRMDRRENVSKKYS